MSDVVLRPRPHLDGSHDQDGSRDWPPALPSKVHACSYNRDRGKTFMARLALLDAQARGFATSFVVVSNNDLRFHRFDDVYRQVITELGTASCTRGALGDLLDRWIGKIKDGLIAAGADENAPDFDRALLQRAGVRLQPVNDAASTRHRKHSRGC
ncbi:BREX system ATP-binding domain-containing protein [Sorangium sp. So ce117]